jgi:hypothetical protein
MAAERILPPPFFEERLANRFAPKVAFSGTTIIQTRPRDRMTGDIDRPLAVERCQRIF